MTDAETPLSQEDRQRIADGLFLDLARKHERKTSTLLTPEERKTAVKEYEETLRLFQQIVKDVVCPCCGRVP